MSNENKRKGFPIVISAASGTGKTTLSHLLLDSDPDLVLSLSTTTRKPRGNEEDGIDYNFVGLEQFEKMMGDGTFIEHAQVHGNYYGSSLTWTSAQLEAGRDVMFDIDVQGGRQIKTCFPDACLIFIVPPSMAELEDRLRRRGTDTEGVILQRLEAARAEIERGISDYDYIVPNIRLETALGDLAAIVRTERLRKQNRGILHQQLLGNK